MGVTTGAPLSFTKKHDEFRRLGLLAFRPTT
jgi:hypothetical protein